MDNVVLIGMPGCGKSTCGVLLAKALGKDFTDTDLIIQKNEKMALQSIIATKGNEYFSLAEENAVCGTSFSDCVIATGGSVVYSPNAMRYLADGGTIVYLKISYDTMIRRISNIETRGILLRDGETIAGMYEERQQLYERYAELTVDCDSLDTEKTVRAIMDALKNAPEKA